jgi:hypothetical protein
MLPLNPDSLLDLSLLAVERPSIAPDAAEDETLRLFDRCGPSLLRYVASFGLSAEESEDVVQEHGPADPAPNPEARLVQRERRQRLKPVPQALPTRDRRCLFLRAEGLRHRDIAAVLDMSLGAVAKSLARSTPMIGSASTRSTSEPTGPYGPRRARFGTDALAVERDASPVILRPPGARPRRRLPN